MPRINVSSLKKAVSVRVLSLGFLLGLVLLILPMVFFDKGTRLQIMLGDGDTFVHTLPVWSYVGEQWRNLSLPLWTPHIFSGFPLYAEPQTAAFHPSKLLFLFLSPVAAINFTVLFAYGLAGLLTFLLAREEGLTYEASFLAGFSFAFCGYLVGHQAMTGLLMNAAWFPALFFILRRLARRTTYGTVLAGCLITLLLLIGGHPQLMFYGIFFSLFYAAYLVLFEVPPARRTAFLRAAGALFAVGIGLGAFQWIPTLELSRQTFRDVLTYQIFSSPSSPFPSLIVSLISTRLFHVFSRLASEAMLDVGFPVLLLAVLALVFARRKSAFWIFLFTFGSLLYMGGSTPLYRIMFWIPGYNLFRVPSRNGVAVELAVVMLAAHALSALQAKSRRSPWYFTWGAPVALILLYYFGVHRMDEHIFSRLWWDVYRLKQILPWTLATLRSSFVPIAGYLAVLLASLVAMGLILWRWGSQRAVVLALLFLSFAHLWSYRNWIFIATRAQVERSLKQQVPLPADSRFYRTACGASGNWTSFLRKNPKRWHAQYVASAAPNFSLLQGTMSISGYGPFVRRDYSRIAGNMTTSGTFGNGKIFSSSTLNLLGVKYVLVPDGDVAFPPATFSSLVEKGRSGQVTVYENPNAQPLFWGVRSLEPVTRDKFWGRVGSEEWNVADTALLTDETEPELEPQYALPRKIEVREVSGNIVDLVVETDAPAFVASSQLKYPGWRAWIDDDKLELYEVNGLFWGFEVPAGRHHIRLHFIPASLWLGFAIAIACLGALGLAYWKDWLQLRSSTGDEGLHA